jgi:plastocyanin
MRKINTTLLIAAVALPLALVPGCGDDDDGESASTGTTTTETTEAGPPIDDTSGAPAGSVDVSLTEFKVNPSKPSFPNEGVYTLNVTNDGEVTHALEAEGQNGETETEDLAPGDSAELAVNFVNGSYELYCPIGDHEDRGMKTEVSVGG